MNSLSWLALALVGVSAAVVAVQLQAAPASTPRVAVSPPLPTQSSPAQPQYPQLKAACMNRHSGRIRHGFQRGWYEVNSAHKIVTAQWMAGENANEHPDTPYPIVPLEAGMKHMQQASEEILTRFFPLFAAVVDSERVFVAGVTDDGKAVLEVWRQAWPTNMPQPQSDGADSGPRSVNVVLPRRTIERIATITDPQRVHVLNVTPVRRSNGPSTQVIVQYWESTELHLVDLASGAHTLLASATGAEGIGPIPQLGQVRFNALAGRKHATAGFVYFLQYFQNGAVRSTLPDVVVLIDQDYNGTIDTHQIVTSAQFSAPGGWRDLVHYPDWWK